MNDNTKRVMFSSNSPDWGTPTKLFDKLNSMFDFTLDPCCNSYNAKCKKFYTIEEDGLSKSWRGEKVFCNPPYGRQIKYWVKKAYEESRHPGTTVVLLIPARTDTSYWHEYVMKSEMIYFIKGRLHFMSGLSNEETNAAPFPSVVVVFKSDGTPFVMSLDGDFR
tara:strand:- start:13986 stop:14477 length:492 start_codon:yes stop_codon:yes gene_type:complete